MHSIARVTGKDVATAFDLSPYKTACDIGGRIFFTSKIERERDGKIKISIFRLLNSWSTDYSKVVYNFLMDSHNISDQFKVKYIFKSLK